MSNFLLTLAVVVMSVAAATAVAIKDPDQPATLRDRKRRERVPRHPARTAEVAAGAEAGIAGGTAAGTAAGTVTEPRRRRAGGRGGRRAEPRGRDQVARPLRVPASVDGGGFSDHWLPAPAGPTVWVRIRSGFALTVLLTVVGALIAVAVAGVIVFLALALQSAVS